MSSNCPTISGLKFDKRSIQGIERIKTIKNFSSLLSWFMGGGVFANVFLGNSVPEISFNIYSTDWELFTKAMGSVPTIERRLIEDEASYQILDHLTDLKQRVFWEGVLNGCALR